MANKITLTESDLVRLVKKILQEQGFDKESGFHSDSDEFGCPRKKSTQELMKHLKNQGREEYFYCFDIPVSFKSRMMSTEQGAFRWNKQANVLDIYKMKGPYLFFGGPYFGDKLGSIKMPQDFPSKFPKDFSEENGDFPYWEILEGRVCLSVGGFC